MRKEGSGKNNRRSERGEERKECGRNEGRKRGRSKGRKEKRKEGRRKRRKETVSKKKVCNTKHTTDSLPAAESILSRFTFSPVFSVVLGVESECRVPSSHLLKEPHRDGERSKRCICEKKPEPHASTALMCLDLSDKREVFSVGSSSSSSSSL